MIFRLPHTSSRPGSYLHDFPRFYAYNELCRLSGCTYYLRLEDDLLNWFEETGIEYKIQGTDAWGEGITNELFDLVIPDDTHALLFKLTWL